MFIDILYSFFLKAADNALSTIKTINLQKEKYFYGALFNALSTFFYLMGVVEIAKSNSILSIISMCIATFIGTYLPGILIKKSERDKLYIFDITADSLEAGKEFADNIRNENIAIKTYPAYDSNMNKVLSCKVYCTNKLESKIVNHIIPNDFKYHVYSPLDTD